MDAPQVGASKRIIATRFLKAGGYRITGYITTLTYAFMPRTPWGRRGYLWVTLAFFLLSIVGHWIFGWFAYVEEQRQHGAVIEVSSYLIEMGRDTLENWQSEFLQLMWQVAGLALLLYVGSPQSKEGSERVEEKLDVVVRAVTQNGDEVIQKIDRKYLREG